MSVVVSRDDLTQVGHGANLLVQHCAGAMTLCHGDGGRGLVHAQQFACCWERHTFTAHHPDLNYGTASTHNSWTHSSVKN